MIDRKAIERGVVFGLLLCTQLGAQESSGSLRIMAIDPAGAPVQVRGELSGTAGQGRLSYVTGPTGVYRFDALQPGPYRLTALRDGFETVERPITVLPGVKVEVTVTLTLAPVTDSVIVSILPENLDGVPGSTFRVSLEDLAAARPFSIKEALRHSPGIHVVDEDSFGLNLNVGMRGLDPRRTQRTLLLEDGVPVHLAPYSDPSAHYHTPPELIQSVEIVKGSGQIVHGPQTVGGMINAVTTTPAEGRRADLGLVLGNRDFRAFDAKAGTRTLQGHVIVREGAGVREHHGHQILHTGGRALFRLSSGQTLQAKASYYEENSDFTEAGLNQARYTANPLGNPFRNDRFELRRTAAQGIHTLTLNDSATLATTAYFQTIDRASYRQSDDATDQMTANAATGCTGAARLDYESSAAVCGNKMRPRNYDFFGVEPRLTLRKRFGSVGTETVAGMRFHREWVTRRRFNGLTPAAREDSDGTRFRDWNRIRATAVPAYVQTTLSAGSWTVTPGIRTERILSRNRALRKDFNPLDVEIRDTQTMVLPGVGATYAGLSWLTMFAGIHRGFAPPRPDDNLDPTDPAFTPVSAERSTNSEAGFRSNPARGLALEATLFRIDFRNQIVPGQSAGRPDLTWVNAGRTLNEGFETFARLDLGQLLTWTHSAYISAAHTYLVTARLNQDEFAEGVNLRGNRLPYAPRHLFSPAIGYAHRNGFDARIGLEVVSSQFSGRDNVVAASANGMSGQLPGFVTWNGAVNVPLRERVVLFLSAANLADRRYIVSRVNGIHPGRPRQVFGGLRWRF